MAKTDRGRLVWNHSTHLPGLIPVLEKLASCDGIQTVTPGAIARVRAKAPALRIKVSAPIRGGFKLIARKGSTVQEVFVVTALSQEQLHEVLHQLTSSK